MSARFGVNDQRPVNYELGYDPLTLLTAGVANGAPSAVGEALMPKFALEAIYQKFEDLAPTVCCGDVSTALPEPGLGEDGCH